MAKFKAVESNLHHTEHPLVSSDEEAELLRNFRNQREAKERRTAYWKEVMSNEADFERYTANEFLEGIIDYCEEEGNPFVIDDENREAITLLAQYFTHDPEFEKAGYSFRKGLLVYGGVGVGKTRIMNLMRSNQNQSYRMVDCSDIAADFAKRDGGEASLEKYFKDTQLLYANKWQHKTAGYCFDDFGIETEGRYFGNTVNCMERIIEVRYRAKEPLVTHIITNLSAVQIEDRYGVRIKERMREMFNTIQFPTTAKSRRK